MKKLFFTIIAALAALLTSCSHEAEEIARITTISASTDQSTRAEVASDKTSVFWQSGDQLGVFGKNSSSEQKNLAYTLPEEAAGAGTTSGKFQNSSSDITTIYAIMYPYQSDDATLNAETLTCEIPSVQAATAGSFDKSAAIMYAFGSSTNAQLNLAVNFLAITIEEEEDPKPNSIIITSSNPLTGMMKIAASNGSITAASPGAENSVTLTSGSASPLTAGEYYIAVKAGNIAAPTITYIYYNSDHTATIKSKSNSNSITFAAGTNVKPISVNFETGTVTTRKAIQLWDGGPYFAEFNVGATATSYKNVTTYESVCGDYYTWSDAFNAVNTWGPMWQLPTKDQLSMRNDEGRLLVSWEKCDGSADSQFSEGCTIKGYTISGSVTSAFSSNSIFLPAAGFINAGESNPLNRGNAGTWEEDIYYWSGMQKDEGNAYYLNSIINGDFAPGTTTALKTKRFPVRPILNNPL